MMLSKIAVAVAVGLLLTGHQAVRPSELESGGPICLLLAEPLNHFTLIAPPAALAHGVMRPEAVVIDVNYGPGFNAYPQARLAFQHAVNIWRTQLTSPVAIVVQADFSNLGANVLGYAGYTAIARDFSGATIADTWFPGPIANMRAASAITGNPGVTTTFSNVANWYFGTDGVTPAGQYDFVTAVLHELAHGLGFAGSMRVSGGMGAWGQGSPSSPFIYDRHLINVAGQALTHAGTFANNSAALAGQLTSNGVFWSGGHAVLANGGSRPKLYAPAPWASGSSISHLEDASYPAGTPNSLMTHALGSAEAVHDPGPVARGMLADSGWAIDTSCSYILSPATATVSPSGGSHTVTMTAAAGCAWSASTAATFIAMTANAGGSGTATITYSVAANPGAARTGTITVAGQTHTVSQGAGGALGIGVNRASLAFGATNSGTLSNVTAAQAVSVSFTGAAAAWTATTATAWLQISGGAGNGNGQFTVAVVNAAGLPASGTVDGSIVVTAAGIANSPVTIPVRLTLVAGSASIAPFGAFDTPTAGATVAGSIAVTGWALDDVEVMRVELWRDRAAGETTPVYSGTGPGNGRIYIADAVFISGARPDVEAGYPAMPLAHRAGWGYLLLTQGLWNQGNGTVTLHAFAYDREGRSATLGSKTVTASNATAAKPFGSIDTPAFGQTVSGGFWNFGWALTPNATPACTIEPAGVRVSIDSGPLMPVSYGDLRADIAAAFPGYSNGAGAGGAYYIDTTTLSNGTHQIGWYVVDSCNRAEGIGSRFFTVMNGSAVATVAARPPAAAVARAMNEMAPVEVRQDSASSFVYPSASGERIVTIRQDERLELRLPAIGHGTYVAQQVMGDERRPLPLGSSFEQAENTFYWQPLAGFFGSYELEFAGADGAIRVTVVVGSAIRSAIDTPRAGVESSPLVIEGWAIDLAAASGSGVDTVHVWAYPQAGGGPVFLGVAEYGGYRPDIAALYGEPFGGSSYGLVAPSLAPGAYDIVVYPHSAVIGAFGGGRVIRVNVK